MTCGWFVAIVLVIAPAAICCAMLMCMAFMRWLARDGLSGHWGRCEYESGGCTQKHAARAMEAR